MIDSFNKQKRDINLSFFKTQKCQNKIQVKSPQPNALECECALGLLSIITFALSIDHKQNRQWLLPHALTHFANKSISSDMLCHLKQTKVDFTFNKIQTKQSTAKLTSLSMEWGTQVINLCLSIFIYRRTRRWGTATGGSLR